MLLVSIPEGASKPYVTRDHPYKRVGSTNQTMARDEYERLLLERNRHRMLWDMEVNEHASISDLDKVPNDFGLRTDTPEYPLDALREATVNAIIHRDYYDPSGFTEIAIYDDRIEIWNNGMLPTGISFPDLLKPHRSVLRNPLIAKAFFLNGAIKSWGRGTLKILELCRNAGLPEPEYAENSGGVEVTLRKSEAMAPIPEKLTETQKKILQYLDSHETARVSEIAASLGLTNRAVQKNLKELDQMVEWVGKSKNDPTGYLRRK